MFYKFENQTEDGRELYIYGDIVSEKQPDWLSGEMSENDTDMKEFKDALDGMTAGQKLTMYVNSGGGSVFAASTMVSMIKRAQDRGVTVDAYIDGLAGSAASWLALAADNVYAYRNSMMMVHKPLSIAYGNAIDFQHEIDTLDSVEKNVMLPIYMNKAKVKQEDVQAMVDAETWMGADEIATAFNVEMLDEEKQMAACTSEFFRSYKHTPMQYMAFSPRQPKPVEKKPEPVDYTKYEDAMKRINGGN